VRVGEVARIRDRACEACGFMVCTPACEAETARALAEIEANKAAEAERLRERERIAGAGDAIGVERVISEAERKHDREAFNALVWPPEDLERIHRDAAAAREASGHRPGRDSVYRLRAERIAAGASVAIRTQIIRAFTPRRLCVVAGDREFVIQGVRAGMYDALDQEVPAAIYSHTQKYPPGLTLPPTRAGYDLTITVRNIGAEAACFDAAIWGPLPEPPARTRGDYEDASHALRMAANGCTHPGNVACRFCARE
jgi:hypothetical protein